MHVKYLVLCMSKPTRPSSYNSKLTACKVTLVFGANFKWIREDQITFLLWIWTFMTTCVAWSGFSLCPALITDKSAHTVIITASITMRWMIRVNIFCLVSTLNVEKTSKRHQMPLYSLQSCVFVCVGPDHPELNAQVPAQVPHSAGQRHPEAPLQHLQDLRLPGDRVRGCDSISKRQGESLFTLNQLPLIWLIYFA